jgi:hypothetical protein
MSPEHKRIIANVITSLREHPEEWSRMLNTATVVHKDGVALIIVGGTLFKDCIICGLSTRKVEVPFWGGYRSKLLAAANAIPEPPYHDAFAPFGSEQEHT